MQRRKEAPEPFASLRLSVFALKNRFVHLIYVPILNKGEPAKMSLSQKQINGVYPLSQGWIDANLPKTTQTC